MCYLVRYGSLWLHTFRSSHLLLLLAVQVEPADVIIVEGILVLHMEELRSECNMKVYVDTGTHLEGSPGGRRLLLW